MHPTKSHLAVSVGRWLPRFPLRTFAGGGVAVSVLALLLSAATCLPLPETDAGVPDAGVEPEPSVPVDAGPPDLEPPDVVFLAPEDRCLEGTVTFEVEVIDAGVGTGFVSAIFAGVALPLTDDGAGIYTGNMDTSQFLVGLKDLVVTAIDIDNNLVEVRRTFAIPPENDGYLEHPEFTCGTPPVIPNDLAPPTVEIVSPIAGIDLYESGTFEITVLATDDVGPLSVFARAGTVEVELNFAASDRYSGSVPLSSLPEGPIDVVVTATDATAKSATATRAITIDRTPPTVVITEPLNGAEREWLNDVVASVTDANPIDRVTLFEDGVTTPLGSATSPVEGSGDSYGIIHDLDCAGLPRDLTFRVDGRDRAGNVGSATVAVTIRFNAQCN